MALWVLGSWQEALDAWTGSGWAWGMEQGGWEGPVCEAGSVLCIISAGQEKAVWHLGAGFEAGGLGRVESVGMGMRDGAGRVGGTCG